MYLTACKQHNSDFLYQSFRASKKEFLVFLFNLFRFVQDASTSAFASTFFKQFFSTILASPAPKKRRVVCIFLNRTKLFVFV